MPLLYPIGLIALGLAILSDVSQQRRQPQRKTIEACTAEIHATWIKEDGVLRVYHEITAMNCAQIVVECSGPTNQPIPGEVDGHPVLIRYGVLTGAGGIRGVPTFTSFSTAQMDAMRRDEAAQGLRAVSVAPPG